MLHNLSILSSLQFDLWEKVKAAIFHHLMFCTFVALILMKDLSAFLKTDPEFLIIIDRLSVIDKHKFGEGVPKVYCTFCIAPISLEDHRNQIELEPLKDQSIQGNVAINKYKYTFLCCKWNKEEERMKKWN